ncbi:hypothetical protein [Corynebacterium kalidii]
MEKIARVENKTVTIYLHHLDPFGRNTAEEIEADLCTIYENGLVRIRVGDQLTVYPPSGYSHISWTKHPNDKEDRKPPRAVIA